MTDEIFCEKCGTKMEEYIRGHCQGMTCPKCGWGWTTSYFEPIEMDQTVYAVVLDAQDPIIEAIKASAKVFGCNYPEAKRGLTDGSLSISGNAREIQKKALCLQEGKVAFHIEPEFPYPINQDTDL